MAPYDWKKIHWKYHRSGKKNNDISQARLNEAVEKILLVKKRLGLFDNIKPSQRKLGANNKVIGAKAHRDLARQAVRESLVLLKKTTNTCFLWNLNKPF